MSNLSAEKIQQLQSTNSKLAAENTVMRGALGIQPDETIPEQTPQFGTILVDRQGSRRRIAPATENEEKLAAEIAELKARESKALDEARHWHQRLVLTDYAILGNDDAIRRLCEEDAEFKAASQIVSLENARALRAELEAKQKVAFEAQNAAIAITAELEAARKEIAKRDASIDFLKREYADVVKVAQSHAKQRDTALAAKDAAERLINALESIPKTHAIGLAPSGTWQYFGEKGDVVQPTKTARELLESIAALTPAPTQEPPAGGVTISNDSSSVSKDAASLPGPKESAETRPNAIPESSEGCASPAVTHSPASPADVPSEGRGESVVLPAFFLHTLVHMDCEFGAGRSCGESESCVTEYCLPCAAKVISRSGKYRLPPEGSGA